MKKVKALVLFSGGLDSILAAEILKRQGIKITALSFKSCFFNEKQPKEAAKKLKIPFKAKDISEKYLETVKRPLHGMGKGMNPCTDCRILMLKEAKKTMEKEGFDFIATGEVLGQRPMSQNIQALFLAEKESSLAGLLLRPLSAKLLPLTLPEKKGWVDRKKLFSISGRSRKKQMELAKKWKIKKYPTPAGGCLLTDLQFSLRLKELFGKYPECGKDDIELLKLGRHFWSGKTKIVVGRNEKENGGIRKLAGKEDLLLELKDYSGPLTLVRNYQRGRIPESARKKAERLTKYYSTKARKEKKVEFERE